MGWVILLSVLVLVGYLLSLRLHPFRNCPACRNRRAAGRHHGSVYTYAHRPCRRCGGTNRQKRWGTRLGLGSRRVNLPGRGRGGALTTARPRPTLARPQNATSAPPTASGSGPSSTISATARRPCFRRRPADQGRVLDPWLRRFTSRKCQWCSLVCSHVPVPFCSLRPPSRRCCGTTARTPGTCGTRLARGR